MRNIGMNLLRLARSNVRSAARRFGVDLVRHDARPEWERPLRMGLDDASIRTVIDVGASTGVFARRARQTFPSAQVISIEPLPSAFAELSAWARTQESTVRALNVAVGDADGEQPMFLHDDHTQSSSFLRTTDACAQIYPFTQAQSQVTVPVARLDTLLEPLALEDDILLKLDVQGFEDRVLRGASATLERAEACMLEVNFVPLYHGQADFAELSALLNARGLRFAGLVEQVLRPDGRVLYGDALFRRS